MQTKDRIFDQIVPENGVFSSQHADVSINIVTKHLQGFRDFVYVSCNCGAMFEARRAELREQLLIGA